MQQSGLVQISRILFRNSRSSCTTPQPYTSTQLSTCCVTSKELSTFISNSPARETKFPSSSGMPIQIMRTTKTAESQPLVIAISSTTIALQYPIHPRNNPSLLSQLWKQKQRLYQIQQRKDCGCAISVTTCISVGSKTLQQTSSLCTLIAKE